MGIARTSAWWVALCCVGACGTSEPHRRESKAPRLGDRIVDVRAFYGIPVLQKSLFWDGNGETDDAGIKVRHLWHVNESIALGAGLTAAVFMPGGPDALALEGEAVGRIYVLRRPDLGVFGELTGGYMQSTDPVPPGGTEWNFTFSFTGGVELPVRDDLDVVVGATYHHLSNALGRQNDRNPSQNEVQLWLGLGFRF